MATTTILQARINKLTQAVESLDRHKAAMSVDRDERRVMRLRDRVLLRHRLDGLVDLAERVVRCSVVASKQAQLDGNIELAKQLLQAIDGAEADRAAAQLRLERLEHQA